MIYKSLDKAPFSTAGFRIHRSFQSSNLQLIEVTCLPPPVLLASSSVLQSLAMAKWVLSDSGKRDSGKRITASSERIYLSI